MSDDLVKKLRSQIGDDVQAVYDHEALFKLAADRIKALERERRIILDERDRTFALMLERAERAEAERDAANALLRETTSPALAPDWCDRIDAHLGAKP